MNIIFALINKKLAKLGDCILMEKNDEFTFSTLVQYFSKPLTSCFKIKQRNWEYLRIHNTYSVFEHTVYTG